MFKIKSAGEILPVLMFILLAILYIATGIFHKNLSFLPILAYLYLHSSQGCLLTLVQNVPFSTSSSLEICLNVNFSRRPITNILFISPDFHYLALEFLVFIALNFLHTNFMFCVLTNHHLPTQLYSINPTRVEIFGP